MQCPASMKFVQQSPVCKTTCRLLLCPVPHRNSGNHTDCMRAVPHRRTCPVVFAWAACAFSSLLFAALTYEHRAASWTVVVDVNIRIPTRSAIVAPPSFIPLLHRLFRPIRAELFRAQMSSWGRRRGKIIVVVHHAHILPRCLFLCTHRCITGCASVMSSAASRLATAVITSAHSSASLSTVEQNLKCWQLSRHITAPRPSVQRFSHALNTSADSSRIFSAWGLLIDGFGNVSIVPRLTGIKYLLCRFCPLPLETYTSLFIYILFFFF